MINSVSGVTAASSVSQTQAILQTHSKPAPAKPAKAAEDTIHLSAAAKAASDSDHDGH